METSFPERTIGARADAIPDCTPDRTIDISGETCPVTFVLTRLALEGMAAGAVLEVLLRGEEPRRLVPRTLRREGHAILGEATGADGITRLMVRKGESGAMG